MTRTPTEFQVHATLDAYEGDTRVCARDWNVTVPRSLV